MYLQIYVAVKLKGRDNLCYQISFLTDEKVEILMGNNPFWNTSCLKTETYMYMYVKRKYIIRFGYNVLNATFNNISALSNIMYVFLWN
jgi:hypothetical protein